MNSLNDPHGKQNIDAKIVGGVTRNVFDSLDDPAKRSIILANNRIATKHADAGLMGRFIGTHPHNASINTALLISTALISLCLIDLMLSFFSGRSVTDKIWDLSIPVVSLGIGYIFGKTP